MHWVVLFTEFSHIMSIIVLPSRYHVEELLRKHNNDLTLYPLCIEDEVFQWLITHYPTTNLENEE